MKKSRMLLATLVAATLVPSFAFAQDHDYQRDDQRPGYEHRDDHRQDWRRDDHHDARMDAREEHHWNHEWHRGDRLPNEYWDHRYVVEDWRAHRLSEPPRGYNWVQVNGDFVLAQIGTGVVLQMGF